MKKHCLNILMLSLIILYNGCNNSSEPINPEEYEISSGQSHIEYNIDQSSYQIEHSPIFSINYSELKLVGVHLPSIKYYYPSTKYNVEVNKEFILTQNDSFKVEIKHCNIRYNWYVDIGNINLGAQHSWINQDITLLRTEEIINSDSTVSYKFIFKALNKGKGYISLFEEDQNGSVSSNESHGLLIGYTIDPINNLWLNVNEIEWIYNTEKGTFSTVSVKMKGSTNAYRLRGLTHGDGLNSMIKIPIQNDLSFEVQIPVAFSHVEGVFLKTSSELLLYGTIGLPKVISLVNPKSSE